MRDSWPCPLRVKPAGSPKWESDYPRICGDCRRFRHKSVFVPDWVEPRFHPVSLEVDEGAKRTTKRRSSLALARHWFGLQALQFRELLSKGFPSGCRRTLIEGSSGGDRAKLEPLERGLHLAEPSIELATALRSHIDNVNHDQSSADTAVGLIDPHYADGGAEI